jgi:asparagine synthase (glutamine-hydrolysing)
MGTADGRYWIVFNGEIYNYVELREELEGMGYQFRSRTDTEVLLAAYMRWGPSALNRLVGMFAFAIIDVRKRRLFLARDCFGIKPLYYAYWQDGLAFASEITVLLELPGVNRSVNPGALYDYLHSGMTDHGKETLFADVLRVPSAHYLDMPLDNPRAAELIRYWEINPSDQCELSFNEAATRLRDLFLDSIRLHLRSDVPVGAALSGGIDSSAIVMAMRHLDRNLDIHTFSYIADDPSLSEERWVDLIGHAADAKMSKIKPIPDEMATDLDELIRVQGEPFGSTSIYAQSRVFRRAAEVGIKVMLDGQGADELLGGYPDYRLARIASLIRRGRWGDAWRLSSAGSTPTIATHVMSRAMARTAPAIVQSTLRRGLRRTGTHECMKDRWFQERGVEQRQFDHPIGKHLLKNELYRTLTETSLPRLLHYEDRNSMAYSIESRVPFLTPPLAEFIYALPESYLITANGISKAVFRRAMRGIVPDAVLDRRDKLGFPTPERSWLLSLGAWVERVITSEAAQRIPMLDLGKFHQEWSDIIRGARPYDYHVWRWINLILWSEQFRVTMA